MISGVVEYKNIRFDFEFDEQYLRIIPKNESRDIFLDEFYPKNDNGSRSIIDYEIDSDYLIGHSIRDNKVIFILNDKYISTEGLNFKDIVRTPLIIDIKYYISCIDDSFTDMVFYCDELNYIYNLSKSYDSKINSDNSISFLIKNINDDSSGQSQYSIKGINVDLCFGINKSISYSASNLVKLQSYIKLHFNVMDNIMLLTDLYYSVLTFIRYLTFRVNISFDKIELFNGNNRVGYFCSCDKYNLDFSIEIKKKCITYDYIGNNISSIMQDIVDNNIYLEHLPASFSYRNLYTHAFILLLTSAFQFEFEKSFPTGIEHKKHSIKNREIVKEKLRSIAQESNHKQAKIYERLIDRVDDVPLESYILYSLKQYSTIIDKFKNKFIITDSNESIAKSLNECRNKLAHGVISYKIEDKLLPYFALLKRLVYIMQLKYYGIDDENTLNAVKRLFGDVF